MQIINLFVLKKTARLALYIQCKCIKRIYRSSKLLFYGFSIYIYLYIYQFFFQNFYITQEKICFVFSTMESNRNR